MELVDGHKFTATSNVWSTQFQFQDEHGRTLFQMKQHSMLRTSLSVEFQPGALDIPETRWLVMLAGCVIAGEQAENGG